MAATPPRVLLVHPRNPRELTYPLGLACLAATAKKAGAFIAGCDLRVHAPRKLVSLLRRFPFDYVGICALSTTAADASRVVSLVRRMQPSAFVVLGGPHATLAPEDALARTRADALVRGDGEAAFAALVSGKLEAPGLLLRGSGPIPDIHGERCLDLLPHADRSTFPIVDYYAQGILGTPRRTSVVATRGCRLSCQYCSAKALSGGAFRTRSVDDVIDEVRALHRDHAVDTIVFEDDNLVLDRDYAMSLWQALARKAPGLRFDLPNGVHPGLVDEDMVVAMARAGVRSLAFGVESMVGPDRARLHRDFELAHLVRVADRARRVGIVTTGYFLIGLPGQSPGDALRQVPAIRALPFDMVHVSVLVDLPGPSQSRPSVTWKSTRKAMYAGIYADGRRISRLARLGGANIDALTRLARSAMRI